MRLRWRAAAHPGSQTCDINHGVGVALVWIEATRWHAMIRLMHGAEVRPWRRRGALDPCFTSRDAAKRWVSQFAATFCAPRRA